MHRCAVVFFWGVSIRHDHLGIYKFNEDNKTIVHSPRDITFKLINIEYTQ